MSKITDSARGESCTVRLPGICNHNNDTVVFAHINSVRLGHGTGIKNKDIHGAYACSACHDWIDGRVKSHQDPNQIKLAHYEGVFETQLKLLAKGLMK